MRRMREYMRILDCTLRDGGYVNNWNFSRQTLDNIVIGCDKLGIDTVEVGILGKKDPKEGFSTKFNNIDEIPQLPPHRGDLGIAAMGTINEFRGLELPTAHDSQINSLRVAYFKEDWQETVKYAEYVKERGYKVFLQAMATFMYNSAELKEMLKGVNEVMPYAFYMVDSFGVMYPDDVEIMHNSIRENLDNKIKFGFHAHNNIQMAFSNVIKFMEIVDDDSYIDASLMGMGRGAGNVTMELLLGYLNKKKNSNYDIEYLAELIEDNMIPEYEKNYWGYSMSYYYASYYAANAVYVWYIESKGIKDLKSIRKILSKIPMEYRHTLNKQIVDEIIVNL